MPFENAQIYNDPAGGNPSSVGSQIRTDYFYKQALMEARSMQYFMPLADTISMPKNFGKKIKKYHYLPLLDDRNITDQGIDAAGATTTRRVTIEIYRNSNKAFEEGLFATAEHTVAATALTNAKAKAKLILESKGFTGADYAAIKTAAEAAGWVIIDTLDDVPQNGNLYGSSKDVGYISGKLPALSETGGRKNRVGFKRIELEGSIEKFGFFDEYTQESLDFDSDAELLQHVTREMLNGAHKMTEDALQIDLLTAAGVVRYGGDALEDSDLDKDNMVDYGDIMRLGIDLDNNRTPKQTKVITGTRMIDTKVIPAGRVMYVGSELIPLLKGMKDLHDNPAFIPVEKYAAGGTTLNGEEGAIDKFRIVVVPDMMHWEGAGAALGGESSYYSDGTNYNVFPMLVVGDGSFTTIGFQTDGKTVKFKITHKKPGVETADRNDPYGETGFMSIKWYYGFLNQRPERIGLMKTAAPM